MRFLLAAVTALFLIFSNHGNVADADSFSKRLKKGSHDFGAQIGGGYTFDLPPGVERTDIAMLFVFPNWQSNITGLIGESWYKGALFHHVEAGLAYALKTGSGSGRAINGGEWLWGFSPLMAQYKFLSPKRKWAPNILAGAGFSYGNWNDNAYEISTAFEFLLHIGAGVEFYNRTNAWSLNYRLFHVSNSNIKSPNIGLNAHVFSLGMRF